MALSLLEKLPKVYEKITHIEKKGKNKNQGYNFVRSADVLFAIRNAFLELGIYAQSNFEVIGTYDIRTNSGGTMHAASVKATITLHNTETSGETPIVISGLGDGADGGDKGIYKAQTGAVKNALRNAFLIPDEEMSDPEADTQVDEQTRPAPAKYPPAVKKQLPANYEAEVATSEGMPEPEIMPEPVGGGGGSAGNTPNDAQLEGYRQQIVNLQKELVNAGLKASRGITINRKIILYLLSTAGVKEIKNITIPQWEAMVELFAKARAAEGGIEKLVKLINGVALKSNKEETNVSQ